MKEFFSKKIKLNLSVIAAILLLIAIFICWKYYAVNPTSPVGAVLGSIIAGLIVALMQLGLSWWDYQMMQKIEKLRLIEILYDRDNRIYYANLINIHSFQLKVSFLNKSSNSASLLIKYTYLNSLSVVFSS